jgi:hypothetical protein
MALGVVGCSGTVHPLYGHERAATVSVQIAFLHCKCCPMHGGGHRSLPVQRKTEYSETVVKHLTAAAAARQAAYSSELQTLGSFLLLPFGICLIIIASTAKMAWALVLLLAFMVPPIMRIPLCKVNVGLLVYAVYLQLLTGTVAAILGIAVVTFIFPPVAIRFLNTTTQPAPQATCMCGFCWLHFEQNNSTWDRLFTMLSISR